MSDLKTNLQEILQEKQDKIIPENIKKDVQIFDVIGTYEGGGSATTGVKLFETEEEMQADSTAKEGDLAVVYREEIQNMTTDTQTQYMTFPEIVTLPEAFAGDVFCTLRAVDETVKFDGRVMLNSNSFRFDGYTDNGMIGVIYESEDGITYTRTRFEGDSGELTNPVDLGAVIGVRMPEEWNDNLGYFMQVGGMTFDGLYEYNTNLVDKSKYHFPLLANLDLSTSDISIQASDYDSTIYTVEWLKAFSEKIATDLGFKQSGNYIPRFFLMTTGELCFITKDDGFVFTTCPLVDSSNNVVGFGSNELSLRSSIRVYKVIDAENMTYSLYNTYTGVRANSGHSYFLMPDINSITIQYDLNGNKPSYDNTIMVFDGTNINTSYRYIQDMNIFILYNAYLYAQTQLSLSKASQLLPGIIGYGKNGIVTGDGTIYDNIPKQDYLDKLCNINAVEGTGQYAIASQTGAILQPNKLYGCNVADTIDNANMTIAKNTIISQIGNYSDSLKTVKSLYGVNYIVRDNYVYYLSLESDNAVIYKLDKKLNTVERHVFSDAQLKSYVAMDVVDNIMYISSNYGKVWRIIACDISNDTSSIIYSGSLSLSPHNDIRIKVSNGHIYIFHTETYASISSQNKPKLHIKECDISGNNMKTLFDYTPGINVNKFAITSDDKYVIITDIDGETGYIFDIDAKSSRKLSFVGKPQKLCVLPIDDTFIYMIGDTDIYKININDTTVTQVPISNETLTKMSSTYYINGKWYTNLNSELYNVNILSDTSTKLSMPWFASSYLPNKNDSETNFSSVQLQQSYDIIQNNNIVDIYALSASNKTKGIIKLSLLNLNLALDKIDIWNLPKMIITGSTNDNIPVVLCDNLASLSQEEYDQALNTSEQILGEE